MAPEEETPQKKIKLEKKDNKEKLGKKFLVFLILGIIGIVGGVVCLCVALFAIKSPAAEIFSNDTDDSGNKEVVYSDLTGEPLADASLKNTLAYCIQVPNGTDGARPQAGLTDAGVIFEAVAEAGITRFAAIFQNPSSAVIGPIRSLRIYYLEWDTPFDCAIIHAGGPGDAIAAVRAGGYKDMTENYSYMYRGTYGVRRWNNLFTTATDLKNFSTDYGYNQSNINGFTRMTPEESSKARIAAGVEELDITETATSDTSEITSGVSSINFNFGGWPNFNVHYDYNAATNTYDRSYASGVAHEVYKCPAEDLGEKNPEDVCSLVQLSPSVVIAMMVKEGKASDNYHESITTTGVGDAYIFQNGSVIAGSWSKPSVKDQIRFFDENGEEVPLAPGQTLISAVPNYGSVEY